MKRNTMIAVAGLASILIATPSGAVTSLMRLGEDHQLLSQSTVLTSVGGGQVGAQRVQGKADQKQQQKADKAVQKQQKKAEKAERKRQKKADKAMRKQQQKREKAARRQSGEGLPTQLPELPPWPHAPSPRPPGA